jgi:serine/threonine protein kinase
LEDEAPIHSSYPSKAFAIQILFSSYASDQAEREDAANEIRLLASVQHPNVISYKEAFLDGNRLCIIMDYAPDGDLTKVHGRMNHLVTFKPDTCATMLLSGHQKIPAGAAEHA